jgi:hypothetical protein
MYYGRSYHQRVSSRQSSDGQESKKKILYRVVIQTYIHTTHALYSTSGYTKLSIFICKLSNIFNTNFDLTQWTESSIAQEVADSNPALYKHLSL